MEIKSKLLTVVATLLTMSSASLFAKTNMCHYSDFFHLGEDTPAGIHLLDISTDDNIVARRLGDSFYLDDVSSCPRDGGTAIVKYGFDDQHYCVLGIHDGPLVLHPEVVEVKECQGLSYSNLTYDGIFSYKYTLHFRK